MTIQETKRLTTQDGVVGAWSKANQLVYFGNLQWGDRNES